jgi:hypothetical protein
VWPETQTLTPVRTKKTPDILINCKIDFCVGTQKLRNFVYPAKYRSLLFPPRPRSALVHWLTSTWISLFSRHLQWVLFTSRRSAQSTDRLSLSEIARPVFSLCKYLFKTSFKRSRKGILLSTICHILPDNENRWFCLRRKRILSTENNIGSDDDDHVLFITIDVDLGSDRTIRWRCIKWPDIKPHKIRSVTSRSRRERIILNRSFSHHFESNSLYSTLRINETKPMRNGRCVPWSSVVWSSEIPKCGGGKCCYYIPGHNDALCAFWQWSVPFGTRLREIQLFISSNSISWSLY